MLFCFLFPSDIELLLSRCYRITELDVSDCMALTTDIFGLIIRYLKQLEILSISRCYGIHMDAVT